MTELNIDIGCGKNKQPGHIGIDQYMMDGVDLLIDLGASKWWVTEYADAATLALLEKTETAEGDDAYTLADNSVDSAYCSHFLEHLTNLNGLWQRVNFFNELYRVLKPGAKAHLIFPHWCSNRYYGDPTHKEPFSEMGFYYLDRRWRMGDNTPNFPVASAPHTDSSVNPDGYACDFDWTYSYGLHGSFNGRSVEHQQYAIANFKEAATDIIATITKPLQPRFSNP